jgi:WD40 repeat protein
MKSVRVFVSSTFLDMHAERDYLNRIVFPELRSRCAKRGADFVGVDLRWGLTEADTQQRGALDACLNEIERCRPFFVSLLGDRYGWVPPPERIPLAFMEQARNRTVLDPAAAVLLDQYRLDDTLETPLYRLRRDRDISPDLARKLSHFWQAIGFEEAGQSITEREIVHGAWHAAQRQTHVLFYLRQLPQEPISPFPEYLTPLFAEQDVRRKERLQRLKQRILDSRGPNAVVRTYEAAYAGLRVDPLVLPSLVSGEELAFLKEALKHGVLHAEELHRLSVASEQRLRSTAVVALDGIEQFGRLVLEDLWQAIESHVDPADTTNDIHAEQRLHHDRFIARSTRTFIGREELLERMFDYIRDRDERRLLFLTGESGSGKSALMAECARQCRHEFPDGVIVPLFIGAAPGSTDLAAALRWICESLRRASNIDDEISADADQLQVQLQTFLARAAAGRTVILFIDALNQLDPANRSHDLNWLPFYVPQGARVIVSTLEGDCLDAILKRLSTDRGLPVSALRRPEREALVREQLALRSKRLTGAQLDRLIDDRERRDAGLPLYLLVAVEELSLCGDRDAVSWRLNDLPATVGLLFGQVLQRLEHDHTADVTERTLSRIAVSRSGLLESEIIDVLSGAEPDFAKVRWTQLYRALEFYLRPMDETNRSGLINFYHDQLRIAAYRRYLDMDSPDGPQSAAGRIAHEELATCFRAAAAHADDGRLWRTDVAHSLSELPYHLVHAGLTQEARALLLDFDWLQTKLQALDPAAVLADYDLFADDEILRVVEGAMRRSAFTLARDKGQLAGQLVGRLLSYSAPGIRTLLMHVGGWRDQPWLRPLTASLTRPDVPRTESFIGVSVVAMSPDLRHAITCSDEGPVKVWDIDAEKELRTLGGYTNLKCAAAATPDGRRVITGSADDTVRVWAPFESSDALHVLHGHTAPITALAITPDGSRAISASEDQSLKLWDLQRGTELTRFGGYLLSANLLAITPDARRAVSASFDGSLRFWDVESGSEAGRPHHHGHAIKALAVSPDGTRAMFSSNQTLNVLDVERDTQTELAGHRGVIRTIAPTSGALVVSGSDDINLRVWDIERCCQVGILEEHWWSVTAASVTPDGRHAISAARDEMIKVWDLHAFKELRTLRAPSHWINSVAATPDGRHVLTASRDMLIKVWDVVTGAQVLMLSGHTRWANAVAITPDGRRVLSGGDDNVVRVWNLEDGTMITTLGGYGNGVSALAVSPDGRHAISGCWDQTLKIWDLESYTSVHELSGHANDQRTGWIRGVAITPDNRRAVSASQDGTLKIWDVETGDEIRTLTGHADWVMSVAIFPDGQHALSGSADGTLKVWELETGAVVQTMRGHQGFITSVALFPGARLAVSTSEDNTLRVWDVARAETVMSFTGDGELRTCAVTPDGQTIIAGEDSGRLHFLRYETVDSRARL